MLNTSQRELNCFVHLRLETSSCTEQKHSSWNYSVLMSCCESSTLVQQTLEYSWNQPIAHKHCWAPSKHHFTHWMGTATRMICHGGFESDNHTCCWCTFKNRIVFSRPWALKENSQTKVFGSVMFQLPCLGDVSKVTWLSLHKTRLRGWYNTHPFQRSISVLV